MKQIIRIDKTDGSESVETSLSRVAVNCLGSEYTRLAKESILKDFETGTRTLENHFAIYEMREVVKEQGETL